MRWYHYLALFFAGAFLVNSVPHFTNGVRAGRFRVRLRHRPDKACRRRS